MSTRAYTDGGPHIDDPPAYSPPDTYPPPEHGIRLADTPVSTVHEIPGAYDEQDESVPWRRSVEGEVSDLHLASEAEKKRLWWRNAVINAIFIAAWFTFGLLISLYNKYMFSPERFGFPYPLFATFTQMIVQFILASALRFGLPRVFRPKLDPDRKQWMQKAAPTGVMTGLDIGLSNVSLQTITLSFYTMCKSSSLIFVLLFAFLFKLEQPSWRLVFVIFLIVSGVLLMVFTQTHFVLVGFILVMSASLSGGFRWALTQVLLRDRKMGLDNPAATIWWLSPIMAVTLGMISMFVDDWVGLFREQKWFSSVGQATTTCVSLVIPGMLGFSMVLSEYYIIQRIGVVPMSIAGIAKEVATITVSAWVFGDELTPLNITGVSIAISGIGLFTYHKYRKSIESPVPLDAHGNPIVIEDETGDALGLTMGRGSIGGYDDGVGGLSMGGDEERVPLARTMDLEADPHTRASREWSNTNDTATSSEAAMIDGHLGTYHEPPQLLFSVDDADGEGDEERQDRELRELDRELGLDTYDPPPAKRPFDAKARSADGLEDPDPWSFGEEPPAEENGHIRRD